MCSKTRIVLWHEQGKIAPENVVRQRAHMRGLWPHRRQTLIAWQAGPRVQTWPKQHQSKIYLTKYQHTWPNNLLTNFDLDLKFSWSFFEILDKKLDNYPPTPFLIIARHAPQQICCMEINCADPGSLDRVTIILLEGWVPVRQILYFSSFNSAFHTSEVFILPYFSIQSFIQSH